MLEEKVTTKTSTTVVNIKHEKCEIFCGRGSLFGNPYRIGDHGTRDDVIEKYRELFYKKLLNPDFHDRVMALKGKRLGCYCKPLRCHCDIIVEYLDNTQLTK